MVSFATWVVAGLLVAALTRRFFPQHGIGRTATIVVGLMGGVIFGFFTHCIRLMKIAEPPLLDGWSVAFAVFGAMFVLVGYRLLAKPAGRLSVTMRRLSQTQIDAYRTRRATRR